MLVDAPPMPSGCEDVWRIFNELHACRGSSGFGPSRISFIEMDAYSRLKGIRLAPWEIECVQRADLAFINHWKPSKAED
jgi:hypothetical protein